MSISSRSISLLICLLILLTACAPAAVAPPAPAVPSMTRPARPSQTPQPTLEPYILRPSSTPLPAVTPLSVALPGQARATVPPDMNPLTGLRVADPSRLERRPLAIKITNFPRSVRPQWGLMHADHVIEYFLEGELTRFVGIFYGQDAPRVGPVRSGRPFDEQILRMYHAILTFGFADDRVIDAWVKSDIAPYLVIEKPDNCPPLCRIGSDNNYNTLYADTAALSEYVSARGTSNQRQPLGGLYFETNSYLMNGGHPAERLYIRYSPMSYHYWQYDPARRRYQRWQDAERAEPGQELYAPLIDSLSGEQIAADNILLLYATTGFYFVSNDTEIYDHELGLSGDGYALRDGRLFAITWQRASEADLPQLFVSGQPYPLRPGTTWFQIINTLTSHRLDNADWTFTFEIPPTPLPTPFPTKRPRRP